MPWLSIIVFLISFLLSRSSGKTTGQSAAIGAAAGLGTYYLADPSNPDNLLGVSMGGAKDVPGAPNVGSETAKGPSDPFWNRAVSTVGSTLSSWGPAGTLGVVAGTSAILSPNDFFKKYGPWLIVGAVALVALK